MSILVEVTFLLFNQMGSNFDLDTTILACKGNTHY